VSRELVPAILHALSGKCQAADCESFAQKRRTQITDMGMWWESNEKSAWLGEQGIGGFG
jgi:hypothetical protein